MFESSLAILAVLSLNVALCEWLVRRSAFLRHLGTALLVIVFTAVVANARVIPTYSDDVAVYGAVFEKVAPLAVFWLLLDVHFAKILSAGGAMIGMFLLGSLGTFAGVMLGMAAVGGEAAFGDLHAALGGMFVGTYIGGSVNFIAIATAEGGPTMQTGVLYAGAAAVDSLMTTVWMVVTLLVPRLWTRRTAERVVAADALEVDPGEEDAETASPAEVAWLGALGVGTLVLSEALTGWLEAQFGLSLPSILVLTTLALGLAQVPSVRNLRGKRLLGMYSVYLFLAVIGALCDVSALAALGGLGWALFRFVTVVLIVHGVVVYGGTLLLRGDVGIASVASQANIGGGTTALALARSLGRAELTVPAILVGALGTALGTYAGLLAVALLR